MLLVLCKVGMVVLIKRVIESGGDVNVMDNEGILFLMFVVLGNWSEFV